MVEWWVIALILIWIVCGVATWLLIVLEEREITVGDVLIFPLIAVLGMVALILWVLADGPGRKTARKVLWRW